MKKQSFFWQGSRFWRELLRELNSLMHGDCVNHERKDVSTHRWTWFGFRIKTFLWQQFSFNKSISWQDSCDVHSTTFGFQLLNGHQLLSGHRFLENFGDKAETELARRTGAETEQRQCHLIIFLWAFKFVFPSCLGQVVQTLEKGVPRVLHK